MVTISGSAQRAADSSLPPVPRSSKQQRRALLGVALVIALLTLVGWGILFLVTSQTWSLGSSGVFGIGLGVTAYTLGMRHAFDADHIAAIDNTTRKLMAAGDRPVAVGFWFALGHSSVVFVLCLLLGIGVRQLAGQVIDQGSALQQVAGFAGTLISGVFLLVIGLINLAALRGIIAVFTRMRSGEFNEAELTEHLNKRGLLSRLLVRVTRTVTKSWQMFPVGLLFGLGFDTATEVSLLVLAGGAAAFQLPWYAILCLPLLFAAGMTLFDTIDGCFMNFAYGWAFSQPVRKVYYNLTVTTLSVVTALGIGTIELLGLGASRANATSGFWGFIAGVDGSALRDWLGYGIVLLFVVAWAAAVIAYRVGRVEERWSAHLRQID